MIIVFLPLSRSYTLSVCLSVTQGDRALSLSAVFGEREGAMVGGEDNGG